MNDYSKSFTFTWASISLLLLLLGAFYVNGPLSAHKTAEAAVVSEVKGLSERFVDPMRRSQNIDLVETLERFRSSDALSKMQAPELVSLISESPSVSSGIGIVDESINHLKEYQPSAAGAKFESLLSQVTKTHADHKKIILYANIALILGLLLVFGLLLRRIAILAEAVQVASEYLVLGEEASHLSEYDLEEETEEYSENSTLESSESSESSAVTGAVAGAVAAAPAAKLLTLEEEMQGVLSLEVERTGHLATLHGSSLDDEMLPNDKVDVIKTIFESLIRNAVKHGGRSPREREQARKDKTLNVFIGLDESETEYTLTVADDGEGIHGGKARDHALEQKLIAPDVAKGLTQDTAARLVFLPGFSTNKVEGNSLNLERLRALIKEHNGSIGMQNKVGDLCKFIVRLPKPEAEPAS